MKNPDTLDHLERTAGRPPMMRVTRALKAVRTLLREALLEEPRRRSFNAAKILGFEQHDNSPLPEPDHIYQHVLRYGGWSLNELLENAVVQNQGLMAPRDWCEGNTWVDDNLQPGDYRLLLDGSEHVVLVASLLAAHLSQTGLDLSKGRSTFCSNQLPYDQRLIVEMRDGAYVVDSVHKDQMPERDADTELHSATENPDESPAGEVRSSKRTDLFYVFGTDKRNPRK